MTVERFRNREDAGRQLAMAVSALFSRKPEMRDPVVLALPRGGVPVATEVARVLGAPLDLVMVRKIGVPFQPELAAAAVVNGDDPQLVINRNILRMAGMSEADVESLKARELATIDRRRKLYLKGRMPESITGRDAVVIDDGVATGATMRAAVQALRRKSPRSLTLAVPVAPRETAEELTRDVDHFVCLFEPPDFRAIGAYYGDFRQLSDEEVVCLLQENVHR